MARGFISGVVWGLIFAIGTLWIVSQIGGVIRILSAPEQVTDAAPIPIQPDPTPEPQAPVPDTAATGAPARPSANVLAEAPAADAPPAPETAPAEPPAAPAATSELNGSPETSDTPVAAAGQDATVVTSTTEPPVPPMTTDTAPEPAEAPAAPVAENDEPAGADALAGDTSPVETVPEPDTGPSVVANAAEPARPESETRPVVDFSAPVEIDLPEEAETAEVQQAPNPPAQVRELGQGNEDDAPGFVSGPVVVNRPGAEAGAPLAEVAEGEDAVDSEGLPALQAFARPFENPEGRPLMAIVLLTDEPPVISGNETEFPLPITFAVDASASNATDLMRKVRELGQEVLALTPLAEGAAPSDVATAFEIYLQRVPQAVGVLDTPDGAFQAGREIAAQVTAQIGPKGMGMITFSRGLNSGLQVASRDDVPAALIFNQIDADGRDRTAMKRFLDQAAFKAGQQSGVIMFGHNRPETIAAIMEWSLGNRASTVTIAPVSALLNQ